MGQSEPVAVWKAQPGSQSDYLSCPIYEVLYEGSRGPGKTDATLMAFAGNTGKGYGSAWRGVIFRREYKELDDVVTKAKKWFPQIFPGSRFLNSKADYKYIWPGGEELLFRAIKVGDDYWNFHGHEYPFVAFEELTNWPTSECYEAMKSCSRCSDPRVPLMYRATANPFGRGHSWVKQYFVDPAPAGRVITNEAGKQRVRIFGSIAENQYLTDDYIDTLRSVNDPNKRKAWLHGSWDIAAGGIFEGCWDADAHVIEPFQIPASWYVDRAFDWGSSKPYSVGFFAESDGTEATLKDGSKRTWPRGTVFHIGEVYGWTGTPNTGTKETNTQICNNIRAAEDSLRGWILKYHRRIYDGPADTSIFDVINGDSYADEMARNGVAWERAHKGSGSRVQGWDRMREMFAASREVPQERPGFFVFNTCRQWIRTVPMLIRDDKKPDDVDTESEDHAGDMTRYRLVQAERAQVGVTNIGWTN